MKIETKELLQKSIIAGLLAALGIIAGAIGLTSCNVTRTVTNKSEYYQKGDTSIVIQTKISESYDGTKK